MINKSAQPNQKNFFQETIEHSNNQSPPTDYALNKYNDKNSQQPNSKPIPTFLKPNHFNQSSQTIKHMLMDRFKHKKQVLFQSSSIYIDTGEVKKKHSVKDKAQIVSQIKNTSLEKLPFLNKEKRKTHANRLSQTIDAYSQMNKSVSPEEASNPSYSTLESSQNLGKAKLHLLKRKSLHEPNELSSTFVMESGSKQKELYGQSPKSGALFMGFDEEVKKKYLKSIVDRYFPNEESAQKQVQYNLYAKSQVRELKQLRNLKPSNNKSPVTSPDKLLKQSKLPILNSPKVQFSNDSRHTRSQSTKQAQQSEALNNIPASPPRQQFQNANDHLLINSNSSSLSLSQSYLLQKIDQDQQEAEGLKGQDFYNSIRLDNKSATNYFPHLTHQSSEMIMNSSSHDLFDLAKSSQSSLQSSQKHKQQKIKIFQNQSFSIFKIKHTSFQNLSQNHNLKTLSVSYEFRKYFLNEPSMELKRRELRAKQIIMSECGQCFGEMWEEDMFDKLCIKLNITKNCPPCDGKLLPLTLSKMLYKISPQMQSGSSSFLLIKPSQTQKPTPFVTQHTLLSNSHSGLLSLILNLSIPFSQLSGSLINNKLSVNNIFYRDYNSYAINEWGYSYFRQDFMIQDKQFEKRLEPILKNEFGEWFVTPEYLAPQILQNLCFSKDEMVKYWVKRQGKKMEKSIVKEHDLFEYGNKSDVWSMGLMVLQIITLIPVWIGQKCMVQNRTNPSIKPRRGLLYAEKRDLLKILTKQSYLKENLNKIIRIQSQPYQIQEWLLKLLHRMLDLDAKSRISFAEIAEELRNRLKK